MRVFVHMLQRKTSGQWLNQGFDFKRVPAVGEFVSVDHDSFVVLAVVHLTERTRHYDAEIYCVRATLQGLVPETDGPRTTTGNSACAPDRMGSAQGGS